MKPRAMGMAFLALVLSACSGTHASPPTGDAGGAGGKRDATTGPPDASLEAGAPDVVADEGGDETSLVMPHRPDSGPPPCYGAPDCPVGELCCANLGGERGSASCIATTACPAGLIEVCGRTGGDRCSLGKCSHYRCTLGRPGLMSDIYACTQPFITGVTCGLYPDGGFGDSG